MTTYNTYCNRNGSKRRGVTLMLVLGLMTMFAMLIVSFMVITTHARRTAQSMAQILLNPKEGISSTDGTGHLQTAIDTLLVGGLDSVIGPHSILENLYSHPDYGTSTQKLLFGQIKDAFRVGVADVSRAGLIEVQLLQLHDTPISIPNYESADLIGSVLTLDFPNRETELQNRIHNTSLRIVAVEPLRYWNDGITCWLAPPENWAETEIDQLIAESESCNFYINTPAYSGTGPGFDSSVTDKTQPALTGNDGTMPYALRPNILAPENNGDQPYKTYLQSGTLGAFTGPVLMSSDYNAPDYRTMFMAWNNIEYVDASTGWVIKNVIPSFHRPQLVRYWNDISNVRKYTLRPSPADHPDFTGSNPAATSGNYLTFLKDGPWDVDNDGDGVPDGIWLDIGLPTVTEDGQLYKPLVSYYVLDMDGRLNVNVHGNKKHSGSDTTVDVTEPFGDAGGTDYLGTSSGTASVRLDLGLGIVESNAEDTSSGVTGSLFTNADQDNPGRYNEGEQPQQPTAVPDINDHFIKMNGVNPSAFGNTQPDFWGNLETVFDPLGNRHFLSDLDLSSNDLSDPDYLRNPYLFNPYQSETADTPFDAANDIYFLLRSFGDSDYNLLKPRLRKRLNEPEPHMATFSKYRHHLTTRSSSIPAPNRTNLFARIYTIVKSEYPTDTDIRARNNTNAILSFLPEILAGRAINVNKFSLPPYSDWNDNDADRLKLLIEKSKFASGLFYLAMISCYEQLFSTGGGAFAEGNLDREAAIKRIAQWAVNVVDFSDNDSIMTPLIYDKDKPFEGLIVDQHLENILNDGPVPSTLNYRVVWGMENPEVAITETFAVHNRRVADSIKEGTATHCDDPNCDVDKNRVKTSTCTGDHDEDYDQVLIPEGSLFVELYRQGNPQRNVTTDDTSFYETDGSLDLAKKVMGGNDYVWRMVIGQKNGTVSTNWTAASSDTDRPHDALAHAEDSRTDNKGTYSFQPKKQFPNSTKNFPDGCDIVPERIVWFGVDLPSTGGANQNNSFKVNDDVTLSSGSDARQLKANEYLVVAPRTYTSFRSKHLDSGASPAVTHFGVPTEEEGTYIDLDDLEGLPDFNANSKTPKYIVAEMDAPPSGENAIGLNVSAPLRDAYYPTPTEAADSRLATLSGVTTFKNGYTGTTADAIQDDAELKAYGTIPAYRTIMLQRLADPTRAWNEINNPYITVDWNVIDLHVINSEKDGASEIAAADEPDVTQGTLHFTSRQWGKTAELTKTRPNVWMRHIGTAGDYAGLETVPESPNDETNAVFNQFKELTLGWLNVTAGVTVSGEADDYEGAPNKAFMHFPWFDAPLNNSFELMLVPTCSPGRFGVEFTDQELTSWSENATSLGGSGGKFADPKSGIGMYFNYFDKGDDSLNLSELFEYVRVPSKFSGSLRWTYNNDIPPKPVVPIYALQEPGKINLNTATASAWEGLKGTTRTPNFPPYEELVKKRMGNLTDTELTSGNYPSEFASPFRAPGAANLVPPLKSDANALVQKPAETGLFHRKINASTTEAFIKPDDSDPSRSDDNIFAQLQPVLQMGDLTTGQSNVFAVWITVGYFKAEPITSPSPIQEAIYGDKSGNCYRLGAERGSDGSVAIKRPRAFYLLDRSIPVGFRRGMKLNSSNVIVSSKILDN